jgi:energy-coupling factor transport system substrate-specific component
VKTNALRQTILTAMFLAIIVVQELALSFLPNIQLTFVLFMVFATVLSPAHLVMLVVGYVLLDNLLFGSFNYFVVVPMFLAWGIYVAVSYGIRYRSIHWKILFSALFGLVYGWFYLPFTYLAFYQGVPNAFLMLLSVDLPFGMVLLVNNLFTMLALYHPLTALIKSLVGQSIL